MTETNMMAQMKIKKLYHLYISMSAGIGVMVTERRRSNKQTSSSFNYCCLRLIHSNALGKDMYLIFPLIIVKLQSGVIPLDLS